MPTYQYECLKKWGKGRIKRLLGTGAGLIFKGSGFYITDYRSDSYKSAAKKETESTSPKKSDTTPKPGKSDKPAKKD